MGERPPALLTIEEAAALLRIGRTKAYAMSREWRASGGRSGLPVVDLGGVLRVPLEALEEMTGVHLGAELLRTTTRAEPSPPEPSPAECSPATDGPVRSRTRTRTTVQPALFDPPRAS